SAISERPNSFLKCAGGTLPLRKPLICTWSLTSSRRGGKRTPSSLWGVGAFSSRLGASLGGSVGCLSLFALALGADPTALYLSSRGTELRGSDPILAVRQWCGRRDSNPHDLRHRNLNPARLPVPPRPRCGAHSRRGGDRALGPACSRMGREF